jgi:hypothetical protein
VSAPYATIADLYRYGLARGNLVLSARECGRVDIATDTIELDNHGFENDDKVSFRPCEGAALPVPLVEGAAYFAKKVSHTLFAVSLTAGGTAINITAASTGSFFVGIEPPLTEVIEYYSRWVDDFLPAHAAPLTAPYPVQVTATVAELAAKKLMQLAGHKSESVDEFELSAKAKLERWAKGIVVRNATPAQHTNLAVTAGGRPEPRSLP